MIFDTASREITSVNTINSAIRIVDELQHCSIETGIVGTIETDIAGTRQTATQWRSCDVRTTLSLEQSFFSNNILWKSFWLQKEAFVDSKTTL